MCLSSFVSSCCLPNLRNPVKFSETKWLKISSCQHLNSVWMKGQFGCHPVRSTTHALTAIQHKQLTTFDEGGSVRVLFIDFRKAFDLVDHNILITKLKRFNVPNCLIQWFQSYLAHRCQRVKIDRCVFSWRSLNGGMPQVSWLGPLSFIALIDDLHALCEVHKYVDDTTLSELIALACAVSNMSSVFATLLLWMANNNMQINTSKTKMFLGRLNAVNFPRLSTPTGSVERVTAFKLLGIIFQANFSWCLHINTITSKTSKHFYFLKQLKRAGVPTDQLLHFYVAVIRPVLEYCTPVWHYAITCTQTEQIKSIQKCAIRTIFPLTPEISYPYALFAANLNSLHFRRYDISKSFFQDILWSIFLHSPPPPTPTWHFCFISAQNSHSSPTPILPY